MSHHPYVGWGASRGHVSRRTWLDEPGGGGAHGLRQPRVARGRARLLRRHSRRPADPARAAGRSRRALPAARDPVARRPSSRSAAHAVAAQRRHRGDARRPRARARAARLHRDEALDAAHRRRGRAGARRPARAPSSGSCSRRTTRGSRSPATGSSSNDALAGRAELRFVESWHDEPGFVELLADRVRGTEAHVVFTAHSLPERILAEGDPYQDQLLETSRLVAERAGLARVVVLVPERVGDRRAVARPGHPRPPRRPRARAASRAFSSARSASSPTTSRSSGTSTTRRPSARASSGSASRGSRCRTPSPRSSRFWPGWSGAPFRYRRAHEAGRDPDRGSRAGGSASTPSRRGR